MSQAQHFPMQQIGSHEKAKASLIYVYTKELYSVQALLNCSLKLKATK